MLYILGLLTMASLMATIRNHPPANLERYLWALLLEIPFLWAGVDHFGVWSWQYAVIYCVFTTLVLSTIIRIAVDCLRGREYRARAVAVTFILAVVPSRVAYMGLPRPVDGYSMISLVEGFILAWAGTLCAFLAPYMKRRDLIFPLALFWLVQAGYSFGWSLHGHVWDSINWVLPPALGIACFSILAWRLRAVPREV